MGFLNIGMPELLLIIFLAIIIFGPTRLKDVLKGLGEGLREFKSAYEGSPPKKEEDLVISLAKKLGISTEGKSREELEKEVYGKAKEKGLL